LDRVLPKRRKALAAQLACCSRAKTTLFARGPRKALGALAEMAMGHFSQLKD